jgi:outer membrane protein OmpA-like peptidoglycan-associated protein
MKGILFLIFLVFVLLFSTEAQNLVPNPDFEEYEECPTRYTTWIKSNQYYILIPGWNYPTAGTPDYFNRCATSLECSIPENEFGISEPYSGDGYAGLFAAGRATKTFREYIDCQLLEPLKKGQKYCVSFYYKLSSYSYYAVDNLGLYFLGHKMHKSTEDVLTYKAQVTNPDKNFLTNKSEWKELTAVYEATGNEYYLIIGNFDESLNDYTEADKSQIPKHLLNVAEQYRTAYYFIDNVSVKPLTNCKDCNQIPHDLTASVGKASFTGGASGDEKDGVIEIKAKNGTKPYKIEWSNGKTTPVLTGLGQGTYKYKVTDFYNCIVEDEVNFSGPLKVFAESGFEGGTTGWINLTPKGGVPPYRYKWEHGPVTEDVDNLGVGTYVYTVFDQANNSVTGNESFDEFSGQLSNIVEGGTIVLKNIFFDFDKTELLAKSFVELNKIVDFMQKNNIRLVEISGHTDSKGSDNYNQKLSEARAKSVSAYLIFKGVEKERLTYEGYGEVQPIATNGTDEGRQQNRRVEFKILKK